MILHESCEEIPQHDIPYISDFNSLSLAQHHADFIFKNKLEECFKMKTKDAFEKFMLMLFYICCGTTVF